MLGKELNFNMKEFYEYLQVNGLYKNTDRLKFYLTKYLFKDIDIKGKRLLDIGGGRGIFGFYAAISGASKVVIMEPEFDGSTAGVEKDFNSIKEALEQSNIIFTKELLQKHKTEDKYDIILLHNSINHLNEEACETLLTSEDSRIKYINVLEMIAAMCNDGCQIIVCDCSKYSFYSDLGMKNPFARNIEWNKHQAPHVWRKLLSQVGFKDPKTYWTSYNVLKSFGRILMGNRIMAYLTFSHFMLRMKYKK